MSDNYVLSTLLEPSVHSLAQCSHSIFSGRFCYRCFVVEETKALRDGALCLGSWLKHYPGSPPPPLNPLREPEKLPEVVHWTSARLPGDNSGQSKACTRGLEREEA